MTTGVVRSVSDVAKVSIDRRGLLRKAAGLGIIAATAGLGLTLTSGEALADDTGYYRTTSRLNLRSGASTSKSVILVMPDNAMVTSLYESKNGFRYVSFQGTEGWAHGDYLVSTNGGSSDYPQPIGVIHTTDSVNFRWEPSLSSSIIQVLPAGTEVDAFDVWENGFRMVGYAQIAGWVHADYLGGSGGPLGGNVVTTSALNLREEANTSSRILTVMPEGAELFRGDVIANDFIGVSYNGISGWAHKDYLRTI